MSVNAVLRYNRCLSHVLSFPCIQTIEMSPTEVPLTLNSKVDLSTVCGHCHAAFLTRTRRNLPIAEQHMVITNVKSVCYLLLVHMVLYQKNETSKHSICALRVFTHQGVAFTQAEQAESEFQAVINHQITND